VKAFTLIELMVAISLMIIFSAGGVVYLNNFNSRQKLDKAKTEVESMVRLAQSYAKSKQAPNGSTDEVRYVTLSNSSNKIDASVNGTATTYFSNKILEDGLTITFNPPFLYFWGGTGQLSNDVNDVNPNFFGPNQKATVTISLNQGVADIRTISINSLGGIE